MSEIVCRGIPFGDFCLPTSQTNDLCEPTVPVPPVAPRKVRTKAVPVGESPTPIAPPVEGDERRVDSPKIRRKPENRLESATERKTTNRRRAATQASLDVKNVRTNTFESTTSDEREAREEANALKTTRSATPLHFIAETIRKQGLSIAFCAKKLGISTEEAERQADPRCDLTLSQLFAWSEVLDAPLPELIPFDGVVPDPIRNRALLLRTMKSARLLLNMSAGGNLEFAAQTVVDQLIELMPELKDVAPWPSVGQSHAARDVGLPARVVFGGLARLIENGR